VNTESTKKQHKLNADEYFAILPEWILDSDISANAIRLYALLNRYANAQGTCFPKQETLANRMRCSIDTVARAAKELMAIGALTCKQQRKDGNEWTSNLYTVRSARPATWVNPNTATETVEEEAQEVELIAGVPAEDVARNLAGRAKDPQGCGTEPRKDAEPNPAPVRYKSESYNQSHITRETPHSADVIAKKIAYENWLPYAKQSGESQKAVIRQIKLILEDDRPEEYKPSIEALSKAINWLARNGQNINGNRITLALNTLFANKPLKGALAADEKRDWDLESENL